MLSKRVSAWLISAAMVVGCVVFSDCDRVVLSCPPPPPMPLRTLYVESELIVVARAGTSRVVRTSDDSVLLRTALNVTSIIKGKNDEPIIYFEQRFPTNGPLTPDSYAKGNNVLVFLTRGEDGAYSIISRTFGLKELSDSDLNSYLTRIAELAKIMEGGKPDPAELVEWLVRCAEDPATRWEGAYELSLSASRLWDVAEPEENAEASDEDEASETGDDEESEKDEASDVTTAPENQAAVVDEEENLVSTFALLLTESQRTRLVDALIASANAGEADSSLVWLASRWNDPRLVPFLVTQLRREPIDFDAAYEMMDVVARVLNDKSLARLSERYLESGDNRTDADDEAVQADTPSADGRQLPKEILQRFLRRVDKISKR